MMGSIVTTIPNMTFLLNDFNKISDSIPEFTSTTKPSQILQSVISDSPKYFTVGTIAGAAAAEKTAEIAAGAKDIATDIKDKVSGVVDKVKERQKDQLQKFKDIDPFNLKGTSKSSIGSLGRSTNFGVNSPLRGKIGSTSAAKY